MTATDKEARTDADRARIARLPTWAKQLVRQLDDSVDYWRRKATAGPDESDTFVWGADARGERPLGTGPSIVFRPDGTQDEFRVYLDGDVLNVSVGGRMSRALLVIPVASNYAHVVAGDYR